MNATGSKTTAADAPQRPPIPLILREVGMTPDRVRRAASYSRLRYAIGQSERVQTAKNTTAAN